MAQLAEAGVMIAPVGQCAVQELTVAEKFHGKLIEKHTSSCHFVRLIGKYGFPE
jgi:protein-L-isoaspartate O-methyltransferase